MTANEKILGLIKISGLTYLELEKRTGIPKSTLQRYANGIIKKIPFESLKLIAKEFEVPLQYFTESEKTIDSDLEANSCNKTGIGERIKLARKNKGISQTELANEIGISKQTLYKYENGIVNTIPFGNIKKIADVLLISLEYLLGFEDELNERELHKTPNPNNNVLQEILSTLSNLVERTETVETKLSKFNDDILGVYRNMGVVNTEFFELKQETNKLKKAIANNSK